MKPLEFSAMYWLTTQQDRFTQAKVIDSADSRIRLQGPLQVGRVPTGNNVEIDSEGLLN